MNSERAVSCVVSIAIGLVLSPIIDFFGGIAWFEAGGKPPGDKFGAFLGLAGFVLIVWKCPALAGRVLDFVRSRVPEPMFSSIEFRTTAALFVGCLMVAIELFLGHMRSTYWEFWILPAMILSFGAFAFFG